MRALVMHKDVLYQTDLLIALHHRGYRIFALDGADALPSRVPEEPEIVIMQATGDAPGMQIRVIGLPEEDQYIGAIGYFLPDTPSVSEVIGTLTSLRRYYFL
jgi:hypothetical protein